MSWLLGAKRGMVANERRTACLPDMSAAPFSLCGFPVITAACVWLGLPCAVLHGQCMQCAVRSTDGPAPCVPMYGSLVPHRTCVVQMLPWGSAALLGWCAGVRGAGRDGVAGGHGLARTPLGSKRLRDQTADALS